MRSYLYPCIRPLFLRFDFSVFSDRRTSADAWVAASWCVDLFRLWLMNMLTPFGAIGGLLWAALLRQLPAKLSAAAGAFAVGQAIIAYLVFAVSTRTIADVRLFAVQDVIEVWGPELPGYAWLFWSIAAFTLMVRQYLRTRKEAL